MNREAEQGIWLPALLLWLAGNALRLTILAIPPVIALIRDEFALNATQVGLLSSIPPALFAIASLAGSLLVARLGLMGALVGGLLLVGIGSALRGGSGSYATLFVTSIAMAAGVAVMQPIMPTAVRQWLPRRIGFGTAIYTNGLLVGEVLPVWLTIPLVLPAVAGSWRASLVVWSVPIVLIALAVILLAPRGVATRASMPSRWMPDWHRGLVWRLGLVFLAINGTYFSANAFLPVYLKSIGQPERIGSALTALNLGQIPASLLLLVVAGRLERRAWPYIASGIVSLVAVIGLVFDVGVRTPFWAAVLGFSVAAALIIGLTLPPLLCRPEDVARTAAGTFTISYGGAVLVAVVSGAAWDVTGTPAMAFLPIGICAITLTASAAYMRVKSDLR